MENRTPIFLKQALDIVNTRKSDNSFAPFDITIRTFNEQTGKGGKLLFYENVKLLPEANHNIIKKETNATVLDESKQRKRPNHFKNRTRNIEFPDGSVKTIKIDFIITINSHPIIY